jgi:acetolactate synthase regulatory subunit
MQLTAAPPRSTAPQSVARRLELATTGEQDVLPRALGWLRRRGCTFTRVEYRASDRHGPGRFVIAVEAPCRHADRLARGLETLVGVTAVRID